MIPIFFMALASFFREPVEGFPNGALLRANDPGAGGFSMATGLFVAMPVITQILARFEFLSKKFVNHFVNRALNADDRLDVLFGKERLGARSHPSGNNDADSSRR